MKNGIDAPLTEVESQIDYANLLNWLEGCNEEWAVFRFFVVAHIKLLISKDLIVNQGIGWEKRSNPKRVINKNMLIQVLNKALYRTKSSQRRN